MMKEEEEEEEETRSRSDSRQGRSSTTTVLDRASFMDDVYDMTPDRPTNQQT